MASGPAPAFFDTCAIKHRYLKTKCSRRINCIIGRQGRKSYIADWTVVELQSTLAQMIRLTPPALGKTEFDPIMQRFFGDIAAGRLVVIESGRRSLLRAGQLIRQVSAFKTGKLRTGDALIATAALEFAMESEQHVLFYTADKDLHKVVRSVDALRTTLRSRYVDPS